MDPITLAPLLEKYGAWALVAVLIGSNTYAFKGWLGCFESRIEDAIKLSTMLERASAAIVTVSAALESRSGRFERLETRVDEAGQRADAGREKIIGSLDALKAAVDDMRRTLSR